MTPGTPRPPSSRQDRAPSSGQAERRLEAERLYDQARALEPEARSAFLEDACRYDPRLREELESLLDQAEGAEAFFERLTDSVFSSSAAIVEAVLQDDRGGDDPSLMPHLTIGQMISHYRILGRIGTGGMGTVYRARDIRLDREVALKFLSPHLIISEGAEDRLLVEAKAAAALEHPNVCTVHEIGETDDGRPFIAMALCQGETLKARIRRGPLPPEEAVGIAAQIARGLKAAHAHGVVHRDVKPGNVMLTADGTVKLLDFGLAKVADSTLTQPGATPGTVAYMSPEQARGDPLDRRTDLWSLGVVLYEMLTGVRPFRGGNDRAVIQAIQHEEPKSLRKHGPLTPEPLQRIVERLLRKDPGNRYASAEDLLADLERMLPAGAGLSRLPGTPRRRTALLAGAATALLALAGAALWVAGRDGDSGPPVTTAGAMEPSIAVLPLANLSAHPRDAPLADGMTQQLIAMLARNDDLRVIASTSVFAFRDSPTDVRSIADSLGVSNILEGALQKVGSRLRVQVRLVDARDGSTRWSETYDRELESIFAVQDDIARAVASALDLRLGNATDPSLLRHKTDNVAAYELYLRGSDQSLLRSDSGVRHGVEYFRQAIAADSMYAPAYAGLARMYMALGKRDDPGRPVGDLHALAEQAALKAVALDDSLGEAHAVLGLFRNYISYDFASAEMGLKRSIELDPTFALGRQWLAQLYIQTGRPSGALSEASRALEVDPLSPSAHAEVAHALLANGRYDEALARLERIAEVQPPLLRAAPYAAQAYAGKGMWPEAIAALRPQAEKGDPRTLSLYGHMLARGGQREEALGILATLLERCQHQESCAFQVAVVYAGLGDLDQAFAWLDRSVDDHSLMLPTFSIMTSPLFDVLRSDPRFERFAQRLGLQNL